MDLDAIFSEFLHQPPKAIVLTAKFAVLALAAIVGGYIIFQAKRDAGRMIQRQNAELERRIAKLNSPATPEQIKKIKAEIAEREEAEIRKWWG
jgi:hypothetical protein